MRNFFRFTWLPLVMAIILLIIFAGSSLAQAQKQNRLLEGKIDQLSQKVAVLENVRIAGTSTSSPSFLPQSSDYSEDILEPVSTPTVAASTPTPTSATSPKKSTKSTSRNLPTSVVTSSAAPTPTPTPTPIPQKLMTVEIQDLGSFQVEVKEDDTAFSVLLRASQENNFAFDYQSYEGLGVFINCLGGICGHDNYYWAFYYNGQYSMVGASSQSISEGDLTTWKFETW